MCNYECCVTSKNTRKSTCIARGTKKKRVWYIWWYYGHWLAFVPCACAYVYVVCMSVRRGCCCHILDVDSTAQHLTSTNGGENYFDQTVPRTPAIFTSLLHIFDLRSRTTIKKLFSIEVPPCITAIETSHKQKKDVQIGTTNNFPSIHFPSESRQTSHNIFW